MCFSATGSFGSGALLAGIGLVSVVQKKSTSQRLLAWIPLLFAVQQVTEGGVWVTMNDPSHAPLHELAVAVFLGFALIVWPTWMPMSLLAAEAKPGRRPVLRVLQAVGLFVSTYAAWSLVQHRPAAHIAGHSLAYDYGETGSAVVLALYLPAYMTATVLPFFVSTIEKSKLMGGVLVLALLATFLIKRTALTSVWCFFAAIMSGVIVLSIAAEHRIALKTA
jgi:hypothetical protein